jgi:predicted CoA-substrate-specific enzyme activase
MSEQDRRMMVGLDVGSTTVKAVVIDAQTDEILWQDYQRHDTKQPEKVLEFLKQIEDKVDLPQDQYRVFITGSGGSGIAPRIGAKFVQEVNAVALAVEKLYPSAGSVIELGGQDAKIIIFKEDPETGKKKKIPSMNDKCAGGTGAVIDKINAKLRIPADELCELEYFDMKLHPVAGKCGVFAETDINSLQKMGVPRDELMASLFEAIVGQNLSVLTRGNTLRPEVLLLGGPNCFIKGMRDAWRYNIPKMWEERNVQLPEGVDPMDLIKTPENAQYFAAIGAVEFGKDENDDIGVYQGYENLEWYINEGRLEEKKKAGGFGLSKTDHELVAFKEKQKGEAFVEATFKPGEVVEGFVGLDGGSTSTKAVLLDKNRDILVKAYQLSKGNPIEDTMEMFQELRDKVEAQGATLQVMGVGTTGYAKDILKDVLAADVALVETVAHTEAALHFYEDVDVICDVGGQDIKIMILKNRQVKDFKLNTQCSAGNGYFLQSTAADFGFEVTEYADAAFNAKSMPMFGYGCAVFMQSDIVDFQRQGWQPEEIMAGLANVLPKNIWLYVSQIPNLAALGTNFVLQGGTQNNLAAVKAQVDFIESRFKGKPEQPNVIVHKHCGESGAIGAGIEAVRLWENGKETEFIGLDAVKYITYDTHRSEGTRCFFCKNKCLRTFIDVKVSESDEIDEAKKKSKVPLVAGHKRLIVGNSCEKGLVEDVEDMREIKKGLDEVMGANINLVEISAKKVFKSFKPEIVADQPPKPKLGIMMEKTRQRKTAMEQRANIRIGMPRVLNMYSQTPLFTAYFESLGVSRKNLVFSDFTNEKLYKEGAKRGAIDPCFPSKLAIPHIHNLLHVHHKKKPLDIIFFPMIDCLTGPLVNTQARRSCPTVATTPEAAKAAFTKESNLFEELGIVYLDTFINTSEYRHFERQMYDQFKDHLGLSWEENQRAVVESFKALNAYNEFLLRSGREVIDQLEAEDKLGIVMLGRPYHNDPGCNHEILEEFQKIGYPVFTMDSLPIDEDILTRLWQVDYDAYVEEHGKEPINKATGEVLSVAEFALDVEDVWKNSYSENTTRKVWAAKFTARHPNLVALEMSSFKCGHDAPTYTVIEEIIERSGTPYFSFKDIDENKPTGSIRIRVETIAYFLKRYREDMVRNNMKRKEIDQKLQELEQQLRSEQGAYEYEEGVAAAGGGGGG